VQDVREREIRDLPWSVYRATVVVEVHRVRCPECGVRAEKIEQLPSQAPFSKRFEEIVGKACESAAASQVARRFQLPENHGACDRHALPGTLEPEARQTGPEANGRGVRRDKPAWNRE
jgi:anti-sigma factor ChrR (cupin superfamily)